MLDQKSNQKTLQISIQIYYPTSLVLRGRSMCAPKHFNSLKHKTNQKTPASKELYHSLKSDCPKKCLKSLAEL